MFRNKRNSLVKRLWKYRINDETKGSTQKDTRASLHFANTSSSLEDLELKSVTHSFFKRLKEEQLETLVQAMESRGGEVTPCVPVSRSDLRLGRCMMSPYVLCCRVFRWPDLRSDTEMKRLPSCMRQNEDKESVICCNPYHWSLVVKIDEPPIHPDKVVRSALLSERSDGDEKSEGVYPRIMESTETGFTSSGNQENTSENTEKSTGYNCLLWCTVAYWELQKRVGRLFSVTEPSVHIFQQLPHGDGMCLRLFQKPTDLEVVKRTREKIGFGIILSREAAHNNNTSVVGTGEVTELGGVTAVAPSTMTGISVSPLSAQSYLSMSPSLSPPHGESNDKNNSFYSSTSTSATLTSPSDVSLTGDNVDLVCDASGRFTAGCDVKENTYQHGDDGSDIDLAPDYHLFHEQQQPCVSDSSHISDFYSEGMDYTPTLSTSPPYFHQLSHPLLQSQSRSPSCLSSSSFSSSPPSSPPMYFSSDTSFNDFHDSSIGLNPSTPEDTSVATTHIINNNRAHNHLNTSSSKKSITRTSTEINSKNGRSFTSPSTIRNTSTVISTQTTVSTTTTSPSAQPSGLSCKQGEIWVYNASNFPIFVNSPTLDDPQSPRSLVVKKVPPGYSIKIFDYARAELLERTEARNVLLNDGPFDPCSVRISLAKGWGPSYSRQFITSCPCWLELLLGVRRHSSSS